MKRPIPPSRIIKDDYLAPLELTAGAFANALGVTSSSIAAIINEKAGISPEMAIRLSEAFDTTPDLWIGMQRNYDLYKASLILPPKG